jgi:hypothetical protein
MTITISNTAEITEINGVPARLWTGRTDTGIEVQVLITRIAALKTDNLEQFERELQEQAPPPRDFAFPLRMVI